MTTFDSEAESTELLPLKTKDKSMLKVEVYEQRGRMKYRYTIDSIKLVGNKLTIIVRY